MPLADRVNVASSSHHSTLGKGPTNGLGATAELPPLANPSPVAPVVLAILDGWGYRPESDHNAIRSATTPVMDALWHAYPHTLIEASGGAVGLPDEQMGNSEVGHLTIGSGRIIRQDPVRIGPAVLHASIATNAPLHGLPCTPLGDGGPPHLIGLCSAAGFQHNPAPPGRPPHPRVGRSPARTGPTPPGRTGWGGWGWLPGDPGWCARRDCA